MLVGIESEGVGVDALRLHVDSNGADGGDADHETQSLDLAVQVGECEWGLLDKDEWRAAALALGFSQRTTTRRKNSRKWAQCWKALQKFQDEAHGTDLQAAATPTRARPIGRQLGAQGPEPPKHQVRAIALVMPRKFSTSSSEKQNSGKEPATAKFVSVSTIMKPPKA